MARSKTGTLLNLLIRIPIATFLIHHLSQFLFSPATLERLVQFFTVTPYFHTPGQAANDLGRLRKMGRYWPPLDGSGYGELSLVFTISLILLLRLVSVPTAINSVFGKSFNPNSTYSILLNFLLTPAYASVIPCVFLLPMMRLGETHIFVTALNFAHIMISSYIVYFVWFIFTKTQESDEKVKQE